MKSCSFYVLFIEGIFAKWESVILKICYGVNLAEIVCQFTFQNVIKTICQTGCDTHTHTHSRAKLRWIKEALGISLGKKTSNNKSRPFKMRKNVYRVNLFTFALFICNLKMRDENKMGMSLNGE